MVSLINYLKNTISLSRSTPSFILGSNGWEEKGCPHWGYRWKRTGKYMCVHSFYLHRFVNSSQTHVSKAWFHVVSACIWEAVLECHGPAQWSSVICSAIRECALAILPIELGTFWNQFLLKVCLILVMEWDWIFGGKSPRRDETESKCCIFCIYVQISGQGNKTTLAYNCIQGLFYKHLIKSFCIMPELVIIICKPKLNRQFYHYQFP